MYRDAAEVAGVALDFTRMDTSANPQTIVLGVLTDRCRTPHGSCRPVEEGMPVLAHRLLVDPDEMAVVADENLVAPGRPGPATQFLARDPAAADADLDGCGPGRGSGYWHGT